jgi:frataxin-like iron-binding protein CyaY
MMTSKEYETLIDKVLEQIQEDINIQDLTCIEELIKSVPVENLRGFLSEEKE